jgi:hypothetical protein
MATTTIRVHGDTHRALLDLAAESGESPIDTARAAAEALRRERFARQRQRRAAFVAERPRRVG